MDPPDYEDFVLHNQCLVERDPFRDRLLFPEDDIEVQKIPKPCRTLGLLIPEPGYGNGKNNTCVFIVLNVLQQHLIIKVKIMSSDFQFSLTFIKFHLCL